jgi:hypothetical protein
LHEGVLVDGFIGGRKRAAGLWLGSLTSTLLTDKITANFSPLGRRIGRVGVLLRSMFNVLRKFRCYFSEQWKNNGICRSETAEFVGRNNGFRNRYVGGFAAS